MRAMAKGTKLHCCVVWTASCSGHCATPKRHGESRPKRFSLSPQLATSRPPRGDRPLRAGARKTTAARHARVQLCNTCTCTCTNFIWTTRMYSARSVCKEGDNWEAMRALGTARRGCRGAAYTPYTYTVCVYVCTYMQMLTYFHAYIQTYRYT